jgi:cellulose synthase (UDP-forming)
LASIGGHGIGLAEDLVTSIRLHAAGWQSIYNPVVVSRGLVPEDFGSFCKQQLKWARGVHEVLFAELPRLFLKLKGWQRLSYFLIGTYYSVGVLMFFYLLLPFLYFFTGILPAKMPFSSFLEHVVPVGIVGLSIYLYVQKWLCHPSVEKGLHWRGMVLKFACWHVFFMGFIYSIINTDIPYIPTAKKAVIGFFTPFARPLVLHIVVFFLMLFFTIYERRFILDESEILLTSEHFWGMMGFAWIAVVMSIGGVLAAMESHRLSEDEPWANIDNTYDFNKNNTNIIRELKADIA